MEIGMRILWITEYASLIGGCEFYIYKTVELLKKQKFSSTLLYNPLYPVSTDFLSHFDNAFPLVDLKHQLSEINPDLIFVHQLFDLHFLKELSECSYPVIRFFHDYATFCLRRSRMSLILKKPCKCLSSTLDCYPFGFTLTRTHMGDSLSVRTLRSLQHEQALNRRFDLFLAASSYVAKVIEANSFDPLKIRRVNLYAEDPSFSSAIKKDPFLVLFVGQLLQTKGIEFLLKSIALLPAEYHLVIAGTGPLLNKLKKACISLGIESRARFLGKISQNELSEWYQKALCCVLPHIVPEPGGLVGIEAMSYGTPLIASHSGGVSDWQEKIEVALPINPENPHDIATAILKISQDSDLRARLSENGKNLYKKNFTPQVHIQKLIEIFNGVLSRYEPSTEKTFTWEKNPELEKMMRQLLREVKQRFSQQFKKTDYLGLFLIGGYGKGEGGVEIIEEKRHLHNNIDLVMVTPPSSNQKNQQRLSLLRELLIPISEKYSIGFDTSVVSIDHLKNASPLLIWHEMIHGHYCLLGSSAIFKKMPSTTIENIPSSEFLGILVNRGTLLIINEWIHDQPKGSDPNEKTRKTLLKHRMKALIGFGDALLFKMHAYHWSYQEKLKRISQNPQFPVELQNLYAEAARFRFQPDYSKYNALDLKADALKLKKILEPIYIEFEAWRLNLKSFSWNQYLQAYLHASSKQGWTSMHGIKRKLKGLLNPPPMFVGDSVREKLEFWLLTPFQRLMLICPLILFELDVPSWKKQTQLFLNAKSDSWPDLRAAFVQFWEKVGDANFARSSKEWLR